MSYSNRQPLGCWAGIRIKNEGEIKIPQDLVQMLPRLLPPTTEKTIFFFTMTTPLAPKDTVAIPSEEDLGARENQHQLESEATLGPTSSTGSSHRTQYLSDKKVVQNTTVNLLATRGISQHLAQKAITTQAIAGHLALFSANLVSVTSDQTPSGVTRCHVKSNPDHTSPKKA